MGDLACVPFTLRELHGGLVKKAWPNLLGLSQKVIVHVGRGSGKWQIGAGEEDVRKVYKKLIRQLT